MNALERQRRSHWQHSCFSLAMQRVVYIFNARVQKDSNRMIVTGGRHRCNIRFFSWWKWEVGYLKVILPNHTKHILFCAL